MTPSIGRGRRLARRIPGSARRVLRRAQTAWRTAWRAHVMTIGGLLLAWLALWGSITLPLVVVGVLLAVLVLVLFPLPPIEFSFGLHPVSAVVLVSRFLADVVVASVQISYLALRRRPPVTDVVVVTLVSDSDLIQHLTALAVSLVPGSLIIDADPLARTLTIHVLYLSDARPEAFAASVLAQEHRFLKALQGRASRPQPTKEVV